jgi:pseudaminic acid synthase
VEINIGKKKVSDNNPAFIIAELSANHGNDIEIAKKTIKAMKDSGADAVKLQTYTADTITIDCNDNYFKIKQGTIWDGKNLYKLYQEAFTPWEWQPELKRIAEDLDMVFFSSPFDKTAVDFLEKMNVPAYKIASFEITDVNLIEYIAKKGKPIIISTGVAKKEDVELALKYCHKAGNDQVALLKCTSSYPAPLEEMNLVTIPDMAKRYKKITGISDHSVGLTVPIASVALGAKIIEKHFILDHKIGGPDASFSLDPTEFKEMVDAVRDTEKALGKVTYDLSSKAKKSREFSRSLFAVKDIKKGEAFTEENVQSIRPGFGLHPRYLLQVLNKKAKTNIKRGTPLSWKLINK